MALEGSEYEDPSAQVAQAPAYDRTVIVDTGLMSWNNSEWIAKLINWLINYLDSVSQTANHGASWPSFGYQRRASESLAVPVVG